MVPGEFEVTLTVLGETDNIPWTLLNIKILVEDYEIGYGKWVFFVFTVSRICRRVIWVTVVYWKMSCITLVYCNCPSEL